MTEVSVRLQFVTSIRRISNVAFYGDTTTEPLRMLFPTRDRRAARRAARKLELRFDVGPNGYVRWKAFKEQQ